MSSINNRKQQFLSAKKRVRKIKKFYWHLLIYVISVILILYNFKIMNGPYVDAITGLNISILVFWTIIIIIHAWSVFKGKPLFNKHWEEKKMQEYLEDDNEVETNLWE